MKFDGGYILRIGLDKNIVDKSETDLKYVSNKQFIFGRLKICIIWQCLEQCDVEMCDDEDVAKPPQYAFVCKCCSEGKFC